MVVNIPLAMGKPHRITTQDILNEMTVSAVPDALYMHSTEFAKIFPTRPENADIFKVLEEKWQRKFKHIILKDTEVVFTK